MNRSSSSVLSYGGGNNNNNNNNNENDYDGSQYATAKLLRQISYSDSLSSVVSRHLYDSQDNLYIDGGDPNNDDELVQDINKIDLTLSGSHKVPTTTTTATATTPNTTTINHVLNYHHANKSDTHSMGDRSSLRSSIKNQEIIATTPSIENQHLKTFEEEHQEREKIQQEQEQQQDYDNSQSQYVPGKVYIFDEQFQSESMNQKRENQQVKEQIQHELENVDIFFKKDYGEIFGFAECTLLYNHLVIANMIITTKYICFLPVQQEHKDYQLESYLNKKGDFFWKKYWFVLTNDSISWYKTSVFKETHYPNGSVLLANIIAIDKMSQEDAGKPFCLHILTTSQAYLLQADSEVQQDQWYHEITRAQKNLNVFFSLSDIVSISMESNAALFFDSICLTLKRGENCLVTPTSSSNEIYNLLVKLWNNNRGLDIKEPEKQQKHLEFQKKFKLTQRVDIVIESNCLFYHDADFSYEGTLYASEESLYFSSQESALIIPVTDILGLVIDANSQEIPEVIKIYTTDFDVFYFDMIEDIEHFYQIVSVALQKTKPSIFCSRTGEIPPLLVNNGSEPDDDDKDDSNNNNSSKPKTTTARIATGIRSWKIPISIPNFTLSKSLPLFRSKSSSSIQLEQFPVHSNSSSNLQHSTSQQNNLLNNQSGATSTTNSTSSSVSSSGNTTPPNISTENLTGPEKTILIQKDSSINSNFHEAFPLLPLDETVVMNQRCTLHYIATDSTVEGTVFVTKSYIAFEPMKSNHHHHHLSTDEMPKKVLIPFEDIVNITKEKFAVFFNYCIKIITQDLKWIFGSLHNFIGFYNLIIETWKNTPTPAAESGNIFTPLEAMKLRQKFGLPSDENLLSWYNCTNFKGAQLKYGFLYITDHYLCFRSKFGFQKRNIVIPFSQIVEIKKYSALIPNGLKIITQSQQEFQFASFIHRGQAYHLLLDTWKKNANRSISSNIKSPSILSPQSTPPMVSSSSLSSTSQSMPITPFFHHHHHQQQSHHPHLPHFHQRKLSIGGENVSQSSLPPLSINTMGSQSTPQTPIITSPRGVISSGSQSTKNISPASHSPLLIKPMKIVIMTIGSRGDIQPFIALALGLREMGHDVTLASHLVYKDFIEKDFKLKYAVLGGDPKELMDLCVRNGIFTPKFIKEALSRFRSFIDDLLKTCWEAAQGAEALIATPGCFAGPHIAEALQVPFFSAFTMPFTRTRMYPNPFAPFATHQMGGVFNLATHVMMEKILWQPVSGQINAWRTETLKIPAWNSSASINETYRIPYMYCFSKFLVPKPPDWGGEICISGYWNLKDEGNVPPTELVDFINAPGEPPIYIGFGSIVIEDPVALSSLIVEAVKLSGKRAVISQGWGGLKMDTNEQIYMLNQPVAHTWLFERMSMVIHHGGAGTTAAGIYASKPTIVIPFFGDQFFWGERIKDTGIGSSIPFSTLTAKGLSSLIVSMLSDSSIKVKVTQIADNLKKEDGIKEAINFFYRYLPVSFIPPRLQPFTSASNCQCCKQSFSLLHVINPRVHCHHCGKVFCESCANQKSPIKKYRISSPVRVCNSCFDDLQNNNNNNNNNSNNSGNNFIID
ncbi:hypothetical protein CYY_007750 [Polysphondylium violaceum]|uniref:sterol 3beta-glucosyltransferase n=1 Tax=Polysphondylium violaceum TaxID=133409 RepID=A0A8J4PQC2_9MYCE|nr:hypothetical protein CYY_007750 [Polysphondylium violaceum]